MKWPFPIQEDHAVNDITSPVPEKLNAMGNTPNDGRRVKVWVDGNWRICHYNHTRSCWEGLGSYPRSNPPKGWKELEEKSEKKAAMSSFIRPKSSTDP
jgi:hypothetical protein